MSLGSMHCHGLGHRGQLQEAFPNFKGHPERAFGAEEEEMWLWTWEDVLGRVPGQPHESCPLTDVLCLVLSL